MEKNVGLIIPVLNEKENVERIVTEIRHELGDTPFTICIVDDGSKDGTVDIIREMQEKDPRIVLLERVKTLYGCQRGGASRHGMEWLIANTETTVFVDIDADGAQSPTELNQGVELIASPHLEYDVAIASKYLYGAEVRGRTLKRRAISIFYSALARLLFDSRIRDYSNSYRFYNRKAAEYLLTFTPRYTSPVYLLEMITHWIGGGFRIIEAPTRYIERTDNQSKVKFIDLIKGFLGTLRIGVDFHTRRK